MKIIDILEARYQPHGEIKRMYAVYDPSTGEYPWGDHYQTAAEPQNSMMFSAAEHAQRRIDSMRNNVMRDRQKSNLGSGTTSYPSVSKEASMDAVQYYRVIEIVTQYTKNITEAKYMPHGEIGRKYTVYDPKARKYPYTIILSAHKPKPSMMFATAEEATAKIKDLWDRMEQELNELSNQEDLDDQELDDDDQYENLIRTRLSEINHYRIVEIITQYVK
ncbi:hypothetical protein LCGC14_0887350 [marine sediment metagenome]|uniref:Uncharacterized protein n=1 Tax=marine sediment metagenome TaxID=412755 RepID=A0A0F9P575_9ZZZZ